MARIPRPFRKLAAAELRTLSRDCDAALVHDAHYVYYLCTQSEGIVYVGRTSNVMSRMTAHSVGKQRKSFDYALFRRCDSYEDAVTLEHDEIERLLPVLNKRLGWRQDITDDQRLDRHASYVVAEAITRMSVIGK